MQWNEIFEDWPKAEINERGDRTYEFLPNLQESSGNWTFNQTVPVSLYNITYITWKDNSYCDNFRTFVGISCGSQLRTKQKLSLPRCRKISEEGQHGCFVLG